MLAALLIIIGLIIGFTEKAHLFKKPITFAKWCIIILLVASAGVSFYKDRVDSKQHDIDSGVITTLSIRDSVLNSQVDTLRKENKQSQKGYEDSLKNYHNYTTELLAKYGLKVDTAQDRIAKMIRDSISTVQDPTFDVVGINYEYRPKESNTAQFGIVLKSMDAGSTDFNIFSACCFSNDLSGPYTFVDNESKVMDKSVRFAANQQQTRYIAFNNNEDLSINMKLAFFRIRGSYKNTNKSRSFPIDKIFCYNFSDKHLTTITGQTEMNLKKLFSKNTRRM